MCKLIPGKLYIVYSKSKSATPLIFGDTTPHGEEDESSILIEENSLVVYLETIHTKRKWLFMNHEEDVFHFKVIYGDRVLYILDDGICEFKEVNHS
jgi:hypothetical protein